MIVPQAHRLFGLTGYPLSHSFSKRYFTEKFQKEGLSDHAYELFPIPEIQALPALFQSHPDLVGLNVTIPYKEQVIPFLDSLSPEAETVGAVNTIRLIDGRKEGFNTDVFGFEKSLTEWASVDILRKGRALVLGTGGASKAVVYVLKKLGLDLFTVSRSAQKGDLTYSELQELDWDQIRLIVNTTPLGMYPNEDHCPDLPYEHLESRHWLLDLVYNPEKPLFLRKGEQQGSQILNGLPMLHYQAEKAWAIWNT